MKKMKKERKKMYMDSLKLERAILNTQEEISILEP